MSLTPAPPVDRTAGPHVAILLATFDGAAFLPAQLESIAAQDHGNWSLIVSDDGSRDTTLEILGDFARAGHRVTVLPGQRRGAAANFMSLLQRAAEHVPPGSFLAFADQDDVWLPERISRGLEGLGALPPDQPAGWCSRTLITGPNLETPRLSVSRPRPLGFRNALVQNVMAGNTILLNPAAAQLASHLAAKVDKVVMHDWWIYLMLTGVGAQVIHDDRPSLYYRQHGANEVGANDGFLARLIRLRLLLAGRYKNWNASNLAALEQMQPWLTEEARELVRLFDRARQGPLLARLRALHEARLYRQTAISTAALWVSALLSRL